MNLRLKLVLFLFLLAFVATIGRLFFLQIINSSKYEEAADKQHSIDSTFSSKRGSIFFTSSADGVKNIPVALSKGLWDVWVSPKDVAKGDREELVSSLLAILPIEKEILEERINKENDPYEPLGERIEEDIIDKLKELDTKAIHWSKTDERYYPLGQVGAHVLGFLGQDKKGEAGQYGIEGYYEETLSGQGGHIKGFRNPLGFLISPFSSVSGGQPGADVYLTIDYNIQLLLEKELASVMQEYGATGASGVIIKPSTGAVLAMASVPGFNPNTYSDVESTSLFVNPNTQKLFEPGSVFKPITMAVGLDINVISPDLTFQDKGYVKVGSATINNSSQNVYGTQTMTQVLEKSLNTGVVFVVNRIPPGVWSNYLEDFGFAEPTGIDLEGEAKGDIKNVKTKREVEIATSAFGQGVAVTSIELLSAISAIANGGELIEPYFVDRVLSGEELVFKKEKPKVKRRVIDKETAEQVAKMMVSVIENGFGRKAQVRGYSIAGKTGTAQVPGPDGGYSEDTINSFVGFAPAFNPEFAMILKLEHPQGEDIFADRTLAPVFGRIAEFMLHYYGIDPDKPILN